MHYSLYKIDRVLGMGLFHSKHRIELINFSDLRNNQSSRIHSLSIWITPLRRTHSFRAKYLHAVDILMVGNDRTWCCFTLLLPISNRNKTELPSPSFWSRCCVFLRALLVVFIFALYLFRLRDDTITLNPSHSAPLKPCRRLQVGNRLLKTIVDTKTPHRATCLHQLQYAALHIGGTDAIGCVRRVTNES